MRGEKYSEEESEPKKLPQAYFVRLFLDALEKNPNVIGVGIGGEKFADEIIAGAKKLKTFITNTASG